MDAKQTILCAICEEYLKDIPDIESLSAESLEMKTEVFFWGCKKLENEGYIQEFRDENRKPPRNHILKGMLPSRAGLEYYASLKAGD